MSHSSDDTRTLHLGDRVFIEIERSQFGYEPVDLLTYRQSTQWRELMIAGPAKNSAGRQGNSFPGMYYYNPSDRTQWVLMVEGPVNWEECRLTVMPRLGTLDLGLFSTGAIDSTVNLRVWHSQINEAPSQWRAMETLVSKSFELSRLPKHPGSTPDWGDLAMRCLAGLNSKDLQHPLATKLGGIAYHSMWDEHLAQYSRPKPYVELIGQASIARALHRAAQNTRLEDQIGITRTLVEGAIPAFYNSKLGLFDNTFFGKVTSNSAVGSDKQENHILETWYALSNLSDILYLCHAYPASNLCKLATQSVITWMAIARSTGHIFPLFLDVETRESYGGKLNVAAGGLYADVMLAAASLLPDRAEELKTEAAQALTVLRRFPVDQMFHQPEMLARAAESAFLLGADDSSYASVGNDFVHALLLMMYRDPVNGGLFEGCAGMMYPTFRESVASLTTLAALRNKVQHLPITEIIELGLSRCHRFLKHYDGGSVLPVEGLATNEIPSAANVGTAIYAAGGVFDLAYLQARLL